MCIQQQIRALLRGQKVIVVGGDPREAALARLSTELSLSGLIHCPTRKSDSSARRFAARLREPGVVLVVWVLGLSRTHHGEQLHRECRRLQLPWVDSYRIPHPRALIARLENLRLLGSLERRRTQLEAMAAPAFQRFGGAA